VGGTVSGLNGTVVLQINGGQDLSLTNNAAFSFGAALVSGTAYHITVKTQPDNQVCTVANGDGIVGSVAINNVAVTCTTNPENTFSIGGTVTGATGSLYLVDAFISADGSHADVLAEVGNGAFTFQRTLSTGVTYFVSVLNPPAGQTCTVENGRGAIGNSNITNIAVTCATPPATLSLSSSTPAAGANDVSRSTPAVLDFSTLLDATSIGADTVILTGPSGRQQVTVSADGSHLTVTPANKLVTHAPYTLAINLGLRGSTGERLQAPITLTFTTADGQWQPNPLPVQSTGGSPFDVQVAFDRQGNAFAVWDQHDAGVNGRVSIWANRFTPGQGWGTAESIEGSTQFALSPQIAVDASGNAIAVWTQNDGQDAVWANRYSNGGWGQARQISDAFPSLGGDAEAHIGIDDAGNALAVWSENNQIHSSRFDVIQGWAPSRRIDTGDSAAFNPRVVVAPIGVAQVIWVSDDGQRTSVHSARFIAGTWDPELELDREDEGDAAVPQIAIDANGNAIALWLQFGSNAHVWSSRFIAGSGWTEAHNLDPNNTAQEFTPQIAMNARGEAQAVWRRIDGAHQSIVSAPYLADSWGAAQPIAGGDELEVLLPSIALDANGNALAVWQQISAPGGVREVWASRYTPQSGWGQGASISKAELIIDTSSPHAAIDANGNALAVWAPNNPAVRISSNRFE
jgi:hypothetical protein